jgi:N-acetylmuramoyl-L-alanine amidase
MSINPVGIWVRGGGLQSGLPEWTAAIAISLVGWAGVAHGSSIPSNTMTASPLTQSVSIPRLNRSILRIGSQGEEVTEIQGMLKLLGFYSGVVNGVYDNPTAEAVTRFQQAAGLKPDGIVGMDTWDRLLPPTLQPSIDPYTACNCNPSSASPSTSQGDLPILQFGMRGTAVVALQRRLQTQGYFSGIIDGIFGSETEEAVRSAQSSYNLNASGVVDSRLWEVLLR